LKNEASEQGSADYRCRHGIGRATAELVLEKGDRLVATAHRVDRLGDLVERYGSSVALAELDGTDSAAASRAVAKALERFGRLDVLRRIRSPRAL
jgi:NADP-dependent 3-hydroxy acid dehydrogenase YdfG